MHIGTPKTSRVINALITHNYYYGCAATETQSSKKNKQNEQPVAESMYNIPTFCPQKKKNRIKLKYIIKFRSLTYYALPQRFLFLNLTFLFLFYCSQIKLLKTR